MIPRGRLDIGWSDLLAGAAYCLAPRRRDPMERRVEALWSDGSDALVCLSVRSGLDLLLTALAYPEGSEMLISAVTIRDMVRIVEHHGLVPVPVDLDMCTLTVKTESLRRAITPKTKALLAAHLFGSRMPLDSVAAVTREHGLLLIEDCAQSFAGLDYRGCSSSDVSMFSFGPIKTGTALGGALLRVKDASLRARMKALQSTYRVQKRWRFFKRVWRFFLVCVALRRLPFTVLCAVCRILAKNHDELISHSVRGFAGPDFFANIRHQPSYPLLALLDRRLKRFEGARIASRIAAALTILRNIPELPRPGRDASFHSYWTFPIQSEAPDELVRHLWRHGFDATRGTWSLYCVPAPAEHPQLQAAEAFEAMRRVVYLPAYAEVERLDLDRLSEALRGFDDVAHGAGLSPRKGMSAAAQ